MSEPLDVYVRGFQDGVAAAHRDIGLALRPVVAGLDDMERRRSDPTVSVRRYAAKATGLPWSEWADLIREATRPPEHRP